MAASWFLVSMYLIWILASRLIRSNNQSSATLWVLETCLKVGLLPLMIIWITASLSSNTSTRGSDARGNGINENYIDPLLRFMMFVNIIIRLPLIDVNHEKHFQRQKQLDPNSSRAGNPSNLSPVSKEMISDSVELWETAVCFLHIQLVGTNVWLPKMHNVPPEVDFESSRSPAKSVLKQSQSALFSSITHITILSVFTSMMNMWNQSIQAFVTRFGPFVIDRASLFTDHRISGRPIRAKYKHFRTIWEHTCDNSPTDFISSSLKWWSSMHGVGNFVELLCRLVCQLTISFHTLFGMTLHIIRPWRIRRFWVNGNFSLLHPRKIVIQTWFCICQQYLCLFHIVFECTPSEHDPGKMLVLPNQFLCWTLSTSDQDFVSFQPIFMSSTYTDKNNPFSRCTKRHSQFGIFSQPCFKRTFSNYLYNSPAKRMTVQIPFQEERLCLPYWTMI